MNVYVYVCVLQLKIIKRNTIMIKICFITTNQFIFTIADKSMFCFKFTYACNTEYMLLCVVISFHSDFI